MADCYIEGEIGEIRFEGDVVSFTLIPSQDYRRKEGDREYAIKVHKTDLLADSVLMGDFLRESFVWTNKTLASQLSFLKVNRSTVRVEMTVAHKADRDVEEIVAIGK